VHKKFSFYRKQEIRNGNRQAVEFPTQGGRPRAREELETEETGDRKDHSGITPAVEKILLTGFTPACVLVDSEGRILHIHGRTGKYLEPPPGKPTSSVIEMAREGIRFALSSALREAKSSGKEVRRERLRVKTNGGFQELHLTVKPLSDPPALKGMVMIVFEEPSVSKSPPEKECKYGEEGEEHLRSGHILELEQELARVRQDYMGTLEELQASNEELRSTNEEMHSSNEELQSTNEELESSREELQSLNEELSTVNAELHSKIEELAEAYGSITDVLNSTQIAILFLENDLSVKRFTGEAARLINLIDTDAGRPIEHIAHNLKYEKFGERVREVLKSLSSFEDDVETRDGHRYRMRIMAFRTRENVIEGVVITFINIDGQKQGRMM